MKILALISLIISVNLFSISQGLAIKIPADSLGDDMKKEDSFVNVVNNTDYDVVHLVHWACNYMGIKDVTICVTTQPKFFEKDGILIKHDDLYFIYLKKKITSVNKIIIHELIHIQQYEKQTLVRVNGHTVNYKGIDINLNKIGYFQRPYELDAHAEDSRTLNKYLRYKKTIKKNQKIKVSKPEVEIALSCK